mgnify:CR=1 FL=1
MSLGIVSNCFKCQLDEGESLAGLVMESTRRGYSVIELRQGCLGDGESPGTLVPRPDALANLTADCPGVTWDLALGYPCMDPKTDGADEIFAAGCESISRLAGEGMAHLRLVDLSTDHAGVNPADAAASIGRLFRRVREVGGQLSIEHARESWAWFIEVFSRAHDDAGVDRDRLKICFDPCNLLVAPDRPDPAEVTAGLDPELVSMIHIKQRRDGQPWPAVAEGEVDWESVIPAINAMHAGRGFDGPLLFEVAPSRDVWDFLSGSRVYLQRLGLEMGVNSDLE